MNTSCIGLEIHEVLAWYQRYLQDRYAEHAVQFEKRLSADKDGARFEAGVFFVMKHRFGLDVVNEEDTSSGGPDFLCSHPNSKQKFVLEATHLQSEGVTRRSRLPDRFRSGAQFYSLITHKLRETVSRKACQLSRWHGARVLAIGCFHLHSQQLLTFA